MGISAARRNAAAGTGKGRNETNEKVPMLRTEEYIVLEQVKAPLGVAARKIKITIRSSGGRAGSNNSRKKGLKREVDMVKTVHKKGRGIRMWGGKLILPEIKNGEKRGLIVTNRVQSRGIGWKGGGGREDGWVTKEDWGLRGRNH